MVTSVDWLTYPVLHMGSVPQSIEIHLISRPEAAPSGAGEMALGLVPAAVGNASSMQPACACAAPLQPQRVKAALA